MAGIKYYEPHFINCDIRSISPIFIPCTRRAEYTLIRENNITFNLCVDHAVQIVDIAKVLDHHIDFPPTLKDR